MSWVVTFENPVAATIVAGSFLYLVFWHIALVMLFQNAWLGIPWKFRGILLKHKRSAIWKHWIIAALLQVSLEVFFVQIGWAKFAWS